MYLYNSRSKDLIVISINRKLYKNPKEDWDRACKCADHYRYLEYHNSFFLYKYAKATSFLR